MAILIPTVGWPQESSLQRETVDETEFFPHNHTRSRFTSFLNDEVTGVKFEIFVVFAEQKREDPLFQPVRLLIRTPIHEQILGS